MASNLLGYRGTDLGCFEATRGNVPSLFLDCLVGGASDWQNIPKHWAMGSNDVEGLNLPGIASKCFELV